ncbi:MAG: tyrosine-type recombinase/integrase [Gammaproteobacteria bacterium]|nr:tyrosine-type recombinase/integrase [Gammaproteobacteria bacterium]
MKALKEPGLFGDGGTLYLRVAPGGSKAWVQRITIDGRRHDIGLGGYPVVSLVEAREQAFENRRLVRQGRNPLAEKRRARSPTFRDAALKTFEAYRPRWRNAKHVSQWLQTLERHAMPRLGKLPVNRITAEDVLRVLTPIWSERPEIARKVRQRVRTVLGWAQAHGYVADNVAGDGINAALPAMPKQKKHYRALAFRDVPEALAVVEDSKASLAAKCCLRFVVLTACRSGEARNATWDEIDLEGREWRVPAARMKSGVEWRVPLSEPALELLERARPLRDASGLLFPSPVRPGLPMSDMTLTKLLRDTGLAGRCTVHGFRSTFRDWASECTDAPEPVMELSLAHTVGNAVVQAYARSDLLAKRRQLMDGWGAYAAAARALGRRSVSSESS